MGQRQSADPQPVARRPDQAALLRAAGSGFGLSAGREGAVLLRRLRGRAGGDHRLCRAAPRVHPAGDLQPPDPRPAGVPGRGQAGRSGQPDPRPAGGCGPARRSGQVSLAIDVRGLNKSFGPKHVVKDVSIQVEEGRICGFLGPNGSGKTTTLRMLCGLLKPDSGEGTCLGFDIRRQSNEIKRGAGYMTQRFSLYEDLTIEENLAFTARIYGLDRRRERVEAALERLGLTARRRQLAGELSGGWKQRLALAACTLHQPRLLLLDEPTAGVDPKARRDFWDEIHALAAQGLTVLVSTHYMDEAERCHEIGYILNGRLIARGTAQSIIADSRLITFRAEGPGADHLAGELEARPGVLTATAFGQALHVSGTDRGALESSITPYRREPLQWTEVAPTLEDVFIRLMATEEAP
ncbi:MAG: multidrug ABC transporter ATP-binding protein [Caulobacterales bacterium 32-69-10]|nr:MAG: multidrug ABC transporter ATP-binding protein [Caulobacterales bacterium 32-69-10]